MKNWEYQPIIRHKTANHLLEEVCLNSMGMPYNNEWHGRSKNQGKCGRKEVQTNQVFLTDHLRELF